MSDASIGQRARTSADDDALLAEIVAEMKRLHEQIERDDVEIRRLRAESRAIGLETRQIIDDLKARLNPC